VGVADSWLCRLAQLMSSHNFFYLSSLFYKIFSSFFLCNLRAKEKQRQPQQESGFFKFSLTLFGSVGNAQRITQNSRERGQTAFNLILCCACENEHVENSQNISSHRAKNETWFSFFFLLCWYFYSRFCFCAFHVAGILAQTFCGRLFEIVQKWKTA